MEQELITFSEDLRSPPAFSEVRVARSVVLCVVFGRSSIDLFSHGLLDTYDLFHCKTHSKYEKMNTTNIPLANYVLL